MGQGGRDGEVARIFAGGAATVAVFVEAFVALAEGERTAGD